jgi:hypothetical protein
MKERTVIILALIAALSWCFVVTQLRGCNESSNQYYIEQQHHYEELRRLEQKP